MAAVLFQLMTNQLARIYASSELGLGSFSLDYCYQVLLAARTSFGVGRGLMALLPVSSLSGLAKIHWLIYVLKVLGFQLICGRCSALRTSSLSERKCFHRLALIQGGVFSAM